MNYIVLSSTIRILMLIVIRTNFFDDIVRSQPLLYKRLVVPSLDSEISAIN